MSLVVNHNLMAMNTARNLSFSYGKLANSVQRLSSGLRINSAADDAAGLAIREMMRADIATMQQGLRNAADAISLIQTADGALAVIDEKLIRMKELAEQAATGTYTTAQREIINSEYQAMAKEIDRIANATNFNGIKLLDGSTSNMHGGQGIKIHFGVGNNPAEDYYFINIGDARATSLTGLRIGGDAKNDIWGQGAAGAGTMGGPGCCTTGFPSLNGVAGFVSGQSFSYGYNWDWLEDDDEDLLTGKYLAGRYTVTASDSLQALINKVNAGTQSRVGVRLDTTSGQASRLLARGGSLAVCVGDEAYVWGNSAAAVGGSATITKYTYSYSLSALSGVDLFGNSASTVFTDNSALAALMGLYSAAISTIIKQAPDASAAALEIQNIFKRMMNGATYLTTSGTSAEPVRPSILADYDTASAGGTSAEFLYHLALKYFGLQTSIGHPAPSYTSGDAGVAKLIEQGFLKLDATGGAALTAGATSATQRAFLSALGVSTGDFAGTSLTLDIYYNSKTHEWTTSAELGDFLAGKVSGWTKASPVALSALGPLSFDNSAAPTSADIRTLALALNSYLTTAAAGPRISLGNASANITGFAAGPKADGTSAELFYYHSSSDGFDAAGLWTTNKALASALNFSAVTLDLSSIGSLTAIKAALTTALGSIPTTPLNREVTGSSAQGVVRTGIFSSIFSSEEFWTDDRTLVRSMSGFTEVTLNIGSGPGAIDDVIQEIRDKLLPLVSEVRGQVFKRGLDLDEDRDVRDQADIMAAMTRTQEPEDVMLDGFLDPSKKVTLVGDGTGAYFNAYSLASAINHNSASAYWAMVSKEDPTITYIFRKDGGENNDILACEVTDIDTVSRRLAKFVDFEHVETGTWHSAGTHLSLGTNAANVWGRLKPIQTKESRGYEVWNVTLNGRDVGRERDLWITAAGDLWLPGIGLGNGDYDAILNGLDRYSFVEIQNAADGRWAGADVRTQSHAQEALDALNYSINVKDTIRANLGALQNRLENTMTNLEIQVESLQASESRISDVDVAKEMTEFVKNNVLVQAAVGMLAQANSLGQLALSLLGS